MIPDYTPNIWQWFKKNTQMTDEGISAVMGNLWAESNCEPCRLQGDFSDDRSNSKAFAASVDSGDTSVFLSGKYGWGLAQWTYPARCQNLLDFCKKKGTSIADLNSQLGFLIQEMQTEYSSLYALLCRSHDTVTLSNNVMTQYERPYDQSNGAKLVRSNQAKGFYAQFAGKTVTVSEIPPVLNDRTENTKPAEFISRAIVIAESAVQLLKEVQMYLNDR